jgi:mannose-6-phosphate isomerase-like protein (cupin superfamily)
MVFKKGTTNVETRVAMREGPGEVQLRELAPAQGRPAKCRMFSELTMQPGCGIGEHPHVGETEFYYILSGSGVVVDDGVEVAIETGDCVSTGNGASHSITNNGNEPLVVLACVILD